MAIRIPLGLITLLALSCTAASPASMQPAIETAASDGRAQVLILGTYHMGGSGDYIQARVDDVLSPRRQREVEQLVSLLAAFRPTKIMVEAPVAQDSALNARYRRYVAGADTLRRNEIDQVGFRLARQMRHDRVYAVDFQKDEDIGRVVGWAAQNGDTAFVGMVQRFAAAMQARNDSLQALTITEHLRVLNSPAEDAAGQAAYLWMAQVGRDANYVGADVVAGRYERNLKIFANIARLTERGDRVLVIYGSSHGKLLREFVRDSPELVLVDTDSVLAP